MTHKHFSTPYRFLLIALGFFQNMTLGGVLFGWASISGTLLVGSATSGGAGLSGEFVHLMFVTGTFFSFLGPLGLGLALDRWGPRICSVLSIACVCLGSALFGMADNCSSDGQDTQCAHKSLFLVATSLLAFGGPGVQTSLIHLSNLFPQWKASATASLTGAFQISFFVFYLFDYLYEHHQWTYTQLFRAYAVVCLVNLVVSAIMWPDNAFLFEEEVDILEEEEVLTHAEAEALMEPAGKIRLPSVLIPHHNAKSPELKALVSDTNSSRAAVAANPELKDQPLSNQLSSGAYLGLSAFFLVNAFFLNFYIGTFDAQHTDAQVVDRSELSYYARLFTLCTTGGALLIPLAGLCMDLLGFPFTVFITSLTGILWSLSLLLETRTALVFSFLLYSMFRTFVYTIVFAYLADVLSITYLGILAGIMFAASGALSLLQFPLAEWAVGTCHLVSRSDCDQGRWQWVNGVMMLCVASTTLFAYYDFQQRRENERRKKEREEIRSQWKQQDQETRFTRRIELSTQSKYGAV